VTSHTDSEWVSKVYRPARHSIGHFRDGLSRQNANKHIINNNRTVSLTFTDTQKTTNVLNQKLPELHYMSAYVINNGSSNNLPCYPPGSHQFHNAGGQGWHIQTHEHLITLSPPFAPFSNNRTEQTWAAMSMSTSTEMLRVLFLAYRRSSASRLPPDISSVTM